MAKTTKYEAVKKIIGLNKKNFEVGETVTGLTSEQEERLLKVNAIAKSENNKEDENDDDGKADDKGGKNKK